MEIFEITGFRSGVSRDGVNFLEPKDSFENIENGFIYRQILQSRQGINKFCDRLAGATRVFGIFEHSLPDSTKDLLAFDKNYLYKYNTGTGIFNQIAFGGSLVGYPGFNISSNSAYISGTSYPTASNLGRFVFTGSGITLSGTSAVFFYDNASNTVKDFTSLVDNPNYQVPLQGTLNRAKYVIWFGERLNFFSPTLGGTQYTQGILYSGIRSGTGNGDKFAVAGSGLLQADTYESINGASILGQVIAINFDRSNWTLEKTADAFNPYFIRKVPSVLGTDASYSYVSWNNLVKSIGKTGLISTDGRQSGRIDNKIPYFTQDEIDQINFDLTYGGFDRLNNQFLWSYKISESDTDTQNSVLINNYEEDTWSIYNLRLTVFGQTDLGLNLNWNQIDETINPAWARWDTTEQIWNKIGLGKAVQKTLAGDDLGFIYDINSDLDDYITDISAITNASSAVLTISASAFQVGDRVTITDVEGMIEINNFDNEGTDSEFEPWIVTAATTTSVTLNVDSTLFGVYTTGGKLSKVISFKAETIPFNPYREIGRKCYISHVEFLIDNNGGFLKVDVFQDEEEAPYKQDILLLPSQTSTKAREWITMTVDNEANFHTFVLKQESPSTQLIITSIRIHAAPGALTSG